MLSFSPPRRRSPARRALGWATVGLGVLVVVTAAFGLLSGSVPATGPWWWLQLFGVGLPLAMVAVTVGVGVALVGGRLRWLGVFLALLALFFVQAEPWARFGAAEPSDGDLVLLTFNVPRSGPSGEKLANDVSVLFEQNRPDVVALQEALVLRGDDGVIYEPIQVGGPLDSLGFRLLRPFLGRGIPTQVPVLTQPTFELVDSERVALPTSGDGEGRGSEAFRVHFRWDGREGVLYNVHLRSFGPAKPWLEERETLLTDTTWAGYADRYREAFQLRAVEAEALAAFVEDETLPVIIAGDFNSTPANWAFRRLLGERRDAWRVAGSSWWAPTYPADKPMVRIDAVLADPAFEIAEAEVLPDAFSDHRPLRVRLRWRD